MKIIKYNKTNICFITLSIIIFLSCNSLNQEESVKIISIEAFFLNPITHTPERLEVADLFGFPDMVLHHTIVEEDSILFDTLFLIISHLKPDTTDYKIDARIYCRIILSNKDTLSLVMGSRFGTELNGKLMIDNEKLNFLIRKSIRYYKYFPSDLLYHIPELQDTTRLKEVQESICQEK